MARIPVEVEETTLEGDQGGEIPGLILTCTDCGESVEVYGTSAASAKRGAVMLKEQCGSSNWYVVEGYEDD
jgi:hypothetical protein